MIKRSNRLALAAMRTTAVVWSSAYEQSAVMMFDTKLMTRITPNQFHRYGIDKLQHKWQLTLVVVSVEPNGTKHVKRVLYNCLEPHTHKAIVPAFNVEHRRLLDGLNPNYERQAAWIATIERVDFTDGEITAIAGL